MKTLNNNVEKNSPFKAYDIRGKVPEELNENIAFKLGQALAAKYNCKKIVVGRDIRLSSTSLLSALAKGIMDQSCDVVDIGLCGTEQIYFATKHWDMDAGVMITASHNPQGYNGMKLVQAGSKPISGDSGLRQIEQAVLNDKVVSSKSTQGNLIQKSIMQDYIDHLLSYIDLSKLKPLKVVVNPGNGCAGPVIDELEKYLPFEFIKVNYEPDGSFPNGIPNPLLPENREDTAKAVRETGADVGIAWDGDFDRCFFFDEKGNFIEGYYIVGFLAQAFLSKYPGEKIIHDPRLTWNTIDLVWEFGGKSIESKTGHAFIKERMREENAVYGGEMSAHHYFRDFAYCDSGMIPWLLVLEIMCKENKSLSSLVQDRIEKYPASGEINREVNDPKLVIKKVEEHYKQISQEVSYVDGISVDMGDWRFNLRISNTEPVIRLNVESKGDYALMEAKTGELLKFIDNNS